MTPTGLILCIAAIVIWLVQLWQGVENTSDVLLAAACTVLAIWDGIACYIGLSYTVSWRIREIAIREPLALLAMGYLVGHFFGNMRAEIIFAAKGLR